MEYKLKNAIISEYSVSGHSKDIDRPQEQITISFIELEMKYIPFNDDGDPRGNIVVGFDTSENKKL